MKYKTISKPSSGTSSSSPSSHSGVSKVSGGISSTYRKLSNINWNGNRITAAVIWMLGAYLTSRTIAQMGFGLVANPDGTFSMGLMTYVAAGFIQFMITKGEAPIWRGRGWPALSIILLAVDIFITNMPGALPYAQNIGNTEFWTMLTTFTNNPQLQATTSTQAGVAMLMAIVTAAAPEYFWSLPD